MQLMCSRLTSRSPERGRLEQFPWWANADKAGFMRSASFPGTWRTPYCAAYIDDAAMYPQDVLVAAERSPDMKPNLEPSIGQERSAA